MCSQGVEWGSGNGNYWEETSGIRRGFWQDQPNRILTKGRQGGLGNWESWRTWSGMEGELILRTEGFWLNWFSEIHAEAGRAKAEMEAQKAWLRWRREFRGAWHQFAQGEAAGRQKAIINSPNRSKLAPVEKREESECESLSHVRRFACQCRRQTKYGSQSLGREDPLEEGTASHSSIPAWRTPWAQAPGRPQSTGSQSRTWLKQLNTSWELTRVWSKMVKTGLERKEASKKDTKSKITLVRGDG